MSGAGGSPGGAGESGRAGESGGGTHGSRGARESGRAGESGGAGRSGARESGRADVVGSSGGALELRGAGDALLDEPLALTARGAGGEPVTWQARLRDDDGRVWRATADRPEALATAWTPAKATTGDVAALRSLRPVALELRAETVDGRAVARTFRRRLLADGVKVRRWRDGALGTLLLPVRERPCAALVLPAAPPHAAPAPSPHGAPAGAAATAPPHTAPAPQTASPHGAPAAPQTASPHGAPAAPQTPSPHSAPVAPEAAVLPAAALLASRGVLVFVADGPAADALELLAAVPAARRAERPAHLRAAVPLPPGLPTRLGPADAAAWAALLAELGADARS